jgi:hypothetical protein
LGGGAVFVEVEENVPNGRDVRFGTARGVVAQGVHRKVHFAARCVLMPKLRLKIRRRNRVGSGEALDDGSGSFIHKKLDVPRDHGIALAFLGIASLIGVITRRANHSSRPFATQG